MTPESTWPKDAPAYITIALGPNGFLTALLPQLSKMFLYTSSSIDLQPGNVATATSTVTASSEGIFELDSATRRQRAEFVDCTASGTVWSLSIAPDREDPTKGSCSATYPCYEQFRTGDVADANVATTTCASVGSATVDSTSMTSESASTRTTDSSTLSAGNTRIYCRRIQDTTAGTPNLYSKYVRFEIRKNTGACSYSFEANDGSGRCEERQPGR